MPTPVIQQIKAWSYSRFKKYEGCPRAAKLVYIDRRKEPEGPALKRGSEIHKMAEDYLTGTLKKLPGELRSFAQEFKALRAVKPEVEGEWAFTKAWKECGWFGAMVFVRMKVDATDARPGTGRVRIVDFKTGKVRDDKRQLELYGLGALMRYPWAEEVRAEFWFTDQGIMHDATYLRKDLLKIRKKWTDSVRPMLNDKTFAPRPGEACRWCHFKKAKGGPCEY